MTQASYNDIAEWYDQFLQERPVYTEVILPNLLTLLPPGRMRTPTIGIDLLILICKLRLKSATMQVEFDDIGGGKPLLRKAR